MRLTVYLCIIALFFSSLSCKKFLAEYSQNQAFITSSNDLDELLVGAAYGDPGWTAQYLLDDDIEQNPSKFYSGNFSFETFGLHYWQMSERAQGDGTFAGIDLSGYQSLYKRIATLNSVLYNIPELEKKGEPIDQLKRISGEAHYLRAAYYYVLVNTFGKPYRQLSASTDDGVPLKTSPEVELSFVSRSSVKQVYDQIVADLSDAEKELQDANGSSVIRANQAAAQALLSRIYLHMQEYDKVIAYADKVLDKHYQLRDMKIFDLDVPFVQQASSEVIFTMPSISAISQSANIAFRMREPDQIYSADNYRVSTDLINAYAASDLRLKYFFTKNTDGDYLARKSGGEKTDLCDQVTVRLPEIYLNKAEAQAVLDKSADAIKTIQVLRASRFEPADLTTISLTGSALVNFIRDERRRELCFEQHRWFDLHRYAVNTLFPYSKSIRHRSFDFSGGGPAIRGYYQLNPYGQDEAAYTLPVPEEEILFNQGRLKNEARPERSLKQ